MKTQFILRFAYKDAPTKVVQGTSIVDTDDLDGDLIQRVTDIERFLELVLGHSVFFEINVLPPAAASIEEVRKTKVMTIGKMDRLLDQERQQRK